MCGILGIYSNKNVAKDLYYGLFSMQHRGQESCGMAIHDGKEINYKKDMGLVGDVFKPHHLEQLPGTKGIAHVRYSSIAGNQVQNCLPLVGTIRRRNLGIVLEGSLVNSKYLRQMLEEDGIMFSGKTDTEVVLYMIAKYYTGDIVEALKLTMDQIKGAYSLVLLTDDEIVAVRDPHALRPILLGQRDDGEYIFASEDAGIELIGGKVIRDLEPGEIIVIKDGKLKSYNFSNNFKTMKKSCIFEYIYFARNDATIDKVNSYEFRVESGKILAQDDDIKADMVVPVPDSGWAAAIGYANASKIPLSEALVKNRYVGRTFIKPTQEERELGVKIKLNPLYRVLEGKSIILVDDSIVRGTTSKQLVKSLRDAGAKEIHLRITSPEVKYPCYYGIDTTNRSNLLAAKMNKEEMIKYIGCDTLKFLDIDKMMGAVGEGNEFKFCKACFDGNYPVKKIDRED